MRVHRAKLVRKYLRFYRIVFGIDPPYDVILDGNFIFTAIKYKIDILDRFKRLLQGCEVRFHVLKSVLAELNKVGENGLRCLQFAKEHCKVIDDTTVAGNRPDEKIVGFIRENTAKGGRKKFFVATQDKELRGLLRGMPGVPICFFNKVILVLEPPSQDAMEASREIEASKSALSSAEQEIIEKLSNRKIVKRKKKQPSLASEENNGETRNQDEEEAVDGEEHEESEILEAENEQGKERRKRKARAPNPLSCAAASQNSNRQKKLKKLKYRGSG